MGVNMNSTLLKYAGLALVGAITIFAFINGPAHAITDAIFKYSTVKTGHLALHPMEFVPTSQADAASSGYDIHWESGAITATSSVCVNAGLHLPQGATITAVAGWFTASSGGAEIFVGRNNVSTGASDTLVLKVDSDTSGSRKQVNAAPTAFQVVDNAHFMYGIGICMGSTDIFHGARITYTYTNAGD
jgi:hypothetical protein